MEIVFTVTYLLISFITLLSLFLKRKYKLAGIGIFALLSVFVYMLIKAAFKFDFSFEYISSAGERFFILPFVKPIKDVLRGTDTAQSLIVHYVKYLSLSAAISVAVNFLDKEKAVRNLVVFESIICLLNIADSFFTPAVFDTGIYIMLFAGIVLGRAVTKNINLKLKFTEEDYE